MSDSLIICVPQNPWSRVSDERLNAAKAWLIDVCATNARIIIFTYDKPHFMDAGANFYRVACGACGAEMQMGAWAAWMGEDASDNTFLLKPRDMACCGATATLNGLKYEFNQAFGRCSVGGYNMGIEVLSLAQVQELEVLMGERLSVVYCHI